MLKNCPVCKGNIKIKEVFCEECGVRVIGEFNISDLDSIDSETMNFIKVFIFSEGNIKRVEKILNCSYPKVKNYLKKAKEVLGLDVIEEKKEDDNKSNIIDMLDKGKIGIEEAIELLKEND